MKIAIISPWTVSKTAVGGTERFVLDLAKSLKKLENEIDVYMLSGEDHIDEGINFINLKISNTDEYIDEYALKKLFGDFSDNLIYDKIANKLEQLIDIEKYDLIQLNSQLFLKAWQHKKRIFTIHTNPFEYELSFGKNSFQMMLNIMISESKNKNTFFVTPSYYYAEVYKKLTNVTIMTIPHAIDVSRLDCNKSREEICNNLNLDSNLINILLPSRLEPIQKQPMLFMKAFAQINSDIKNRSQIICTGLDKQYLKYVSDIEQFCLENKLNLKIMRFDSMSEAYKIANIVVLPSQSESFGYSALESLSLGIPTIINSIPTYLEIACDSTNSFLFENNVETLKIVINNVFASTLNRAVQNRKWQNRYDLVVFGEKYLNLLKIEKRGNSNDKKERI